MRNASNRILFSILMVFVSACVSTSPVKNKSPRRTSSLPFPEKINRVGPIEDCEMFSTLYDRKTGLVAECSANYVHYFPAKVKNLKSKDPLRIGSFNVFHLGDSQAPLKSYPLIAQIINQWDFVGAQEMMPLPTEWRNNNRRVFEILRGLPDREVSFQGGTLNLPGYLRLLEELRQLDPSWALLMQAQPDGEGNTGEMAGYFYRSSLVGVKEWGYCPEERLTDVRTQKTLRNLGCLLQVPPAQRSLISRTAFAGYFESKNFDFVALNIHVRFKKSGSAADRKTQQKEVCSQHESPKTCRPTQDHVGRYYEVKVVADQIPVLQEFAQDKDVLFMGDFNLEILKKSQALWAASLAGAEGHEVFQEAKTTLTIPRDGLASNYDHFIYHPQQMKNCDPQSVKTFDFTQVRKGPYDNPVLKLIADETTEEARQKMYSLMELEIEKLIKPRGLDLTRLNQKEKSDLLIKYQRALDRMRRNLTGSLLELISDHLPVEMQCQN